MALEYGVVAGRYRSTIADTPDDADDLPQLEPLVGTIIFDPRPEVILVDSTAAEGSMTITPMPTRVQLGANGDLSHNGKPYVKLLSPESSSIDTHDWTYEVSFDLRTLDGQPVRMNSFDIFVKASDTVARPLDLTTATPVIRNTGTQTIIGPSNVLKIGKVVSGAAAQAIITGTSPEQTLDLVLPTGATGATPQISVGTVETVANPADGSWVAALIRGSADVTAALAATFPSTMKGDRGDPGIGLNTTTITSSATSFDSFKTPGTYQWNQTTMGNPPANSPYGTLVVVVSSTVPTRITQTFYPQTTQAQSRAFHQRTYVEGFGWYPWQVYASQRVDNTAGRAVYTWDETANREQLIYGDTGWRNIKDLVAEGWAVTSMRLRRVDNEVTLSFEGLKGGVAGTAIFLLAASIPGFVGLASNGMGNQRLGPAMDLSGNAFRVISPEPTTANIRILSNVPEMTWHGQVQWAAHDPWPTTLPGTAIGTIPNL